MFVKTGGGGYKKETGELPGQGKAPTLQALVDEAQQQWQQAQSYFDFVKEPELVDMAIDNLAAAEKRYAYLLKQLGRK